MIKEVTINNMQSHKHTNLQFESGVNIIIGPSDSGKSAILRALRLVFWNRPLGDRYFRSYWADSTDVTVLLDNQMIKREKGKSNKYILDEIEFKAFKHNPPEEILTAHNLSHLNFQSQIDPFFLLQSSPGEVAEYLNEIAGLEDIDRVQSNIDKRIRSLYQDKSSSEQNLANLQKDLERFEGLDEIGSLIEQAEAYDKEIKSKRERRRQYKELLQHIRKIRGEIQTAERRIEELRQPVERAIEIKERIGEYKNREENLQSLYNKIKQQQEHIEEIKTEVDSNKENFHKHMPSICPLCGQKTSNYETD